jgi:hypothetical protein
MVWINFTLGLTNREKISETSRKTQNESYYCRSDACVAHTGLTQTLGKAGLPAGGIGRKKFLRAGKRGGGAGFGHTLAGAAPASGKTLKNFLRNSLELILEIWTNLKRKLIIKPKGGAPHNQGVLQ